MSKKKRNHECFAKSKINFEKFYFEKFYFEKSYG